MKNWHRQFLARTQMPPTLSGFVINEFFTLRQSERQAVLSRYGVDMRVGAALQIGFLKMCGRALDKFQRVPFAVLEHLNAQVGGAPADLATLRGYYSNAPRILYRHQQLAFDVLGMVRFEAEADASRVLEAICDKVRAGVESDQLLTEIRVILYEKHFVLPAPRVIGDLARRAREAVEHDVAVAIEKTITPATRARWVEQLFEARADGMPCIEFLQEPPGSLTPSSITRQAEKVQTLLQMSIAGIPDLPGTEKYWQMYAAKMRNQRPSRFAQRKEPRRSIELVGFLRHSLAAYTDTLIRMVDRRVSQLWGRASTKAKADQGALPALTVLLAGVRQAIGEEAKPKDVRFDDIVDLVRRYDIGDLKPASVAARQRTLLVKQIQQIRPLLKSLVGLDLKADDASQWPALIAGWKDAYTRGVDGLTKPMTPRESPVWKTLIEDPSTNPHNAAEVQLLWDLRQALRRRTVHVPTSLSYQSRAAMLDPRGSKITAPRSDYGVERMIDELTTDIEAGLERVSEAVDSGELRLDGAKVIVRRLAAQKTPAELKAIRRELYKGYPRVQFPDLIMEVDAQTHFSAELLGRPADNETELQHVYAGILGQAMDLSANRLSLMVGLSPEGLAHAMHLLEDPEPLRRANEAILTFMHSHGISRTWGSPFDCAADAMSLDMPEYIWYTSPDPKRRVAGAATYVHTHGWQGIFSDRSIMITQRQRGRRSTES